MTNLQDHVVSLELAKKLKEAGFKQDSIFCWVEYDEFLSAKLFFNMSKQEIDLKSFSFDKYPFITELNDFPTYSNEIKEIYSAYTASELIGFFKLSDGCYPDKEKLLIGLSNEDEWTIAFRNYRNPIDGFAGVDKNITEAIAKRIIYLNGHGVMEAPE